MLTVGLSALLCGLAIPTYGVINDRLKTSRAKQDLLTIAAQVQRYRTAHDFRLPDSLDDLTGIPRTDPWGGPYQYLNFSSPDPGVAGLMRKDRNLHPINSEFDIYSRGPDGLSSPAVTAAYSQDDVIWARDGSFVDKGSQLGL